jgi:methionyl-tRNA formyltransferase
MPFLKIWGMLRKRLTPRAGAETLDDLGALTFETCSRGTPCRRAASETEKLRPSGKGAINIHGSLLPDYQGLLPSFWVLARGETRTGVTVHFIDEHIDHGDIILQELVPICEDDTVHSLVMRSKIGVGKHLLVEAIGLIERGDVTRTRMDMSRARYFSFPDTEAVHQFRALGRRFI